MVVENSKVPETAIKGLSPDRLLPSEPKALEIARRLYESVRDLPIISPHGHTDPQWYAENKAFPDPAHLFVIPDHYVLRMLFSQGIDLTELGVQRRDGAPAETDSRKIWKTFAQNFHLFRATPSRMWLEHAFEEVFGWTKRLTAETAEEAAPGKSEVLFPPRDHQTSTFFLSGKILRNVESSVYLGVSLTTSRIIEEKHILRVKAAQRRLMQLSLIGIHIRGFNTNLCVMLYRVFVRSIYEYGLHLIPLSLALKLVPSRLESCFFRLVLGKVASRFGNSKLPRIRSLCRLESAHVRRIIIGHQRLSYYQGRRISALQVPNTDHNRVQNLRSACEQLTMFVTYPSIMGMRKSIDLLSITSKTMFWKQEWNAACSNKRGPEPETRPRKVIPCRGSANRVSGRDRGSILIMRSQESSPNFANSIITKIFQVQN